MVVSQAAPLAKGVASQTSRMVQSARSKRTIKTTSILVKTPAYV